MNLAVTRDEGRAYQERQMGLHGLLDMDDRPWASDPTRGGDPVREAKRDFRDSRGAVFLEKLIAYAPLLLLFFMGFQLAELSAAKLVVGRACAAAARAAAVVLPDDPAFYDDVAVHVFEGARRDDVHLAAAIILSAAPQLGGDFDVQVSDPPIEEFGPIDVTVSATYHCGGITLICGLDGIASLSATTTAAYHRAEYQYEVLAGTATQALVAGRGLALGTRNATAGNTSGVAKARSGGDPPGRVGSAPGGDPPGRVGSAPGGDPPDGDDSGGSGSTPGGGKPDSSCDCPPESQAIDASSPNRYVGWKWRGAGITGSMQPRGMAVSFFIKAGPCTPRGSVMFNAMMDHFAGAETVRGDWSSRYGSQDLISNLASYWAARDAGLSPEAAAGATFTGKMSMRRGFTQVSVLTETRDTVYVEFSKP